MRKSINAGDIEYVDSHLSHSAQQALFGFYGSLDVAVVEVAGILLNGLLANPHSLSILLVVDIDQPDALMRAMWNRKAWQPNPVVENPTNGHAHAVWALARPVARTEYARRKPLRLPPPSPTGYAGPSTATRATPG